MPTIDVPGQSKGGFTDYSKKHSLPPKQKIGLLTGKAYDSVLNASVDKVLDTMDGAVLVSDPYQPRFLSNHMMSIKRATWGQIKESLQDMVFESASWRDKSYRKLRLRHWATSPHVCPHFQTWLRAKFLYSINPADGSKWRVMRDPFAIIFFLFTICPLYAVHIWAFVVLFWCIDKKDEYQLVWFILKFKMTQALSIGTFLMFEFSLFAYECLYQISEGPLTNVGNVTGGDWCAQNAPGTDPLFPYEISMEPVRLLLVWSAFTLLWCGYAKGGREELKALEHVRIDAADGALDGKKDTKALRDYEQRADKAIDDDLYERASASARHLYEVPTKHGGSLGYFILYDIAVALAIFVGTGGIVVYSGFDKDDFMLWTTLYYVKALYALSAFPFLVFAVPVVGSALHGARATAYDRAGHLCPKMTAKMIRAKYDEAMQKGNMEDD